MIKGMGTEFVRIYSVKDGHAYALSEVFEVAEGESYYVVVERGGRDEDFEL